MPAYLGRLRYQSGNAAATCTVPKGAILTQIVAHTSNAACTITLFAGLYADTGNGDGVLRVAGSGSPTKFRFHDQQLQAKDNAVTAGSQDVVFAGANLDAWYVEYLVPNSGAAH